MRRAQNEFELKIKKVRSDNGTEFKNTGVEEFLGEEEIKHEFSVPYTPQQNGVVERKNRTLIEAAGTMLDEYKTPDIFWAEAVNTACHAINRLYLHKIYKKTAYELHTNNKPKVDYFRVFGCKCYILNKKFKSSKFAPRVDKGFLLGYASNTHGYRVFNNTTGLVEIAIDVTFDESNGSQGHVSKDIAGNEIPPNEAIKKLAIGEVKPQEKDDDEGRIWMTNRVVDGSARVVGENPSIQANLSTSSHPILEEELLPQDVPTIVENEQEEVASEEAIEQDDQIQRYSLVPHPRVHQGIQRDHPVGNILGSIRRGVTTRSRLAIFFEFYSFVSSLEPLKVEEALSDPDWIIAMQEELNNFTRNEVWSLVARPKQNVIGTKWVFRNKQDENGLVTRNKAWLVA
jgi:hypothetical protein